VKIHRIQQRKVKLINVFDHQLKKIYYKRVNPHNILNVANLNYFKDFLCIKYFLCIFKYNNFKDYIFTLSIS
jgi:hypothetical protein